MLSVKREKLSEQQSFPLSHRQEENGNNEKRRRRKMRERTREREREVYCLMKVYRPITLLRDILFSSSSSSRRFSHACIVSSTKMDRISIITRTQISNASLINHSSRLSKGKRM